MGVVGNVPHVRHALGLHVGVEILAYVNEAIAAAAGKPKQPQLLCCGGIGQQVFAFLGIGAGGEGSEPGEAIEVCETKVHRLPAAHG